MGQVTFHDGHVDPGSTAKAQIRLWAFPEDLEALLAFGSWTIWEGATHVGSVRFLGLSANNSFKPNPHQGGA